MKRDTWYEVTNSAITALDGQLKHEDTNLASSTLIHDPTQKENLGIIVQYKVKQREDMQNNLKSASSV